MSTTWRLPRAGLLIGLERIGRRPRAGIVRLRRNKPPCLIGVLAYRLGLLGLVALLAGLSACAQPLPGSVTLTGHGWGHGRGMGQFGALGYAVDQGWNSTRILDHYYGGTTNQPLGSNPEQRIFLRSREGRDLVVVHERNSLAIRLNGQLQPGVARAVRVHRLNVYQFELSTGDGCNGPWSAPRTVVASEIDVRPTSDDTGLTNLAQLCTETGTRFYRGRLAAVQARDTIETVNVVDTETQLRSVIAREVSPSWHDAGGGRGAAAVQAQAVAARSYAVAGDGRWGTWATTCDDIYCQVYSGVAERPNGGAIRMYEDPRTDNAVWVTAGTVRKFPGGRVASTEFSSSTGGWTVGGNFTAVVDDGDRVAANPNHDWSVQLAADTVEAAFDRRQGRDVGDLEGIDVTARNGLGQDGGRVVSVLVRFTGTDVALTGSELRSTLQLKSDWFTMR